MMNRIGTALATLLLWTLSTVAVAGEKPATTQPYKTAHDAALNSNAKQVSQSPAMLVLRVEFDGIKGDRVPAFEYVPRDGKRTHPAVLLQYGTGANKSTPYIVEIGREFADHGFVVLTIDVPLRGERAPEHQTRWKQIFGQTGSFDWYLGDYSRAVDYLASRPEVDAQRIGYVGISWGAITGVTFVAHDPRVRAMISLVGGGNFLGGLKTDAPPDVKQIAERIDPVYHVAEIAPRPLLLVNARRDQIIPQFYATALHEAAGENAKKVWLDTDHFFRGIDYGKMLDSLVEFMTDNLPEKDR